MAKALYIAEKPSVGREFARVLGVRDARQGYMESADTVVTWCLGHLVTMSYPESYDVRLKHWSLDTLPFIPKTFQYEVIAGVRKQYDVVCRLLHRSDIDTIYVCTDSGREGEYIYRLVEQMAGVHGKKRLRVWIDAQTTEEILRGIAQAKDLHAYDRLAAAAYLRAKEDYLIGINFSRLLTLEYGREISSFLHTKRTVISVGRVMTCVLGMVVRREREIRNFEKIPFYRLVMILDGNPVPIELEWRVDKGSAFEGSTALYKENGFKNRKDALRLQKMLRNVPGQTAEIESVSRKKEKKNPPLLYNLAELQNTCAKNFKLRPDETLQIVQELYEKKLVTYPRTDARVLSSGAAKEIEKNLSGLTGLAQLGGFARHILQTGSYQNIVSTRYVDDKKVTDHYAIIPTGTGLRALSGLGVQKTAVYDLIVRRFLSIFYPPAVYQKTALACAVGTEKFYGNFRFLLEEGYLCVANETHESNETGKMSAADKELLKKKLAVLRRGGHLPTRDILIREGETTPPKRYSSGSMILAMENAGQLIENEELRAQIRGCGIGTSATRAEILKKLISIRYLALNKKTQILTPTQLGEMIYDVCDLSLRSLLNPELTASWERGLSYVADGSVTEEEYMEKLRAYIVSRTQGVKRLTNKAQVYEKFTETARYYT